MDLKLEVTIPFDAEVFADDVLAKWNPDEDGFALRPDARERLVTHATEGARAQVGNAIDDQIDRWDRFGDFTEYAWAELPDIEWDTSFGTVEAWDAELDRRREIARAEVEAWRAAVDKLRAGLPEAFLEAMEEGRDYSFASPEFLDVVKQKRESVPGLSKTLSKMGDAGFVSQTLEVLIYSGKISKSDDKPRKLRKC